MRSDDYDVVVVGARCAGSVTGMLLARGGLRVLIIDRARFPSDTISGHMIKPAGVAYLQRWGLLDPVLETGCPPVRGRHVQFGDAELALPPPPPGSLAPLAPRRVALDAVLLQAASRPARRRGGLPPAQITRLRSPWPPRLDDSDLDRVLSPRMALTERLARQSTRLFGPPPPKDAPKIETWRFVRRIYARTFLFAIPAWIVIALDDVPVWLWFLFGIGAVTGLCGFISVDRRIRRLQNGSPDG